MGVRPIDANNPELERKAFYPNQNNILLNEKVIRYSYIQKAPTLDYAPVRHGEWVQGEWATYPEGYVCNRCSTGYAIPYNYCPSCGAKMDGGDKPCQK